MPWVKLDDRFTEHPKVLAAGPVGLAIHVRALCYSARNLTDGFVPAAVVPALTADLGRVSRSVAQVDWPAVLVSAGLWDAAQGGYQIHDYLEFNPSRERVEAERDASARRVTRWRESHPAKRNATSNDGVTPLPTPVKRECNAPPVPDPVPVPVGEGEGEHASAARAPSRRKRFTPPTAEEVRAYIAELGGACFSAERFVDHHAERGWRRGKGAGRPMRDWQQAVREWRRRDEEEGRLPFPVPSARARSAGALVGAHPPTKEGPPSPPRAFPPAPAGGGVWPAILEGLRAVVDERDFDTWLRGTRQSGELNGVLRVVVASDLFNGYVSAEYGATIRDVAAQNGVHVPIEFVTGR